MEDEKPIYTLKGVHTLIKLTEYPDKFVNNQTILEELFENGSAVKCNICNTIRTSANKMKIHVESKRHLKILKILCSAIVDK